MDGSVAQCSSGRCQLTTAATGGFTCSIVTAVHQTAARRQRRQRVAGSSTVKRAWQRTTLPPPPSGPTRGGMPPPGETRGAHLVKWVGGGAVRGDGVVPPGELEANQREARRRMECSEHGGRSDLLSQVSDTKLQNIKILRFVWCKYLQSDDYITANHVEFMFRTNCFHPVRKYFFSSSNWHDCVIILGLS